MNSKNKTRSIALTGVFAALITALTMVHFSVRGNGYIHFGDGMIYLATSFLPGPYALAAAAIGGALADLFSGYAIWAPFTFVIKAMNALPFALYFRNLKNQEKIISFKTLALSAMSGVITVALYFLSTWILYGFEFALIDVPGSAVQAVGSTVIYCLAGLALDAAKVKSKLSRR